ncbi:MAG: hypothetical protein B6I26_08485 [Desulfobacteraceae bacterium 4572_130]|nr:MAG: hypothetical protein B6I26_08485 [Desulfobacteraceae bacterium 4572_130]
MDNLNNKAKFFGKVTASLSHELQNVLAIIKETSGLMEDMLNFSEDFAKLEDNKLGECIKTIKNQAYRGVDLTSGLNSFAHTTDSIQASINVYETIKKMIFITKRLFQQKGVNVSITKCHKSYSIITDTVFFQMLIFSCIKSLIENFDNTTTITLDINSSDKITTIKFTNNDDTLKFDDYKQMLTKSMLWAEICKFCEQLNFKSEITADTPGILITLK